MGRDRWLGSMERHVLDAFMVQGGVDLDALLNAASLSDDSGGDSVSDAGSCDSMPGLESVCSEEGSSFISFHLHYQVWYYVQRYCFHAVWDGEAGTGRAHYLSPHVLQGLTVGHEMNELADSIEGVAPMEEVD